MARKEGAHSLDPRFMQKAKPFLRWAGGKQGLVKLIRQLLPPDIEKCTYHEPFLGAGSLFFELRPKRALLSDANPTLIDTYKWVREDAATVLRCLKVHAKLHGSEHYYRVRADYNEAGDSPEKAAAFIYLNRACFNGVFRVNRKGEFNVPIGSKPAILVPTPKEMATLGSALKRASLKAQDFTASLKLAKSGHFVYLDPPYPALNGTAFFAHYTKDRFTDDDQIALAEHVTELHNRGCLFLMTNADVPLIRQLYSRFRVREIPVTRFISCKGTRHKVGELVITNYANVEKAAKD